MHFEHSDKVKHLMGRLQAFMDQHIYPNESVYSDQMAAFGTDRWQVPAILEELKGKAKEADLWNLFLPESGAGAGLTNLEYAPLCEIMGRVSWAPEIFNCSAPDTGNMEVFERYGDDWMKKRFMEPLLAGEIRSAFCMTEPDVASSDATNIRTAIRRDGDHYVINGTKWWSSGALDPRCKVFIVMGRTDPDAARHQQQSQILVEPDMPGVNIKRHLPVFGYDDAPHGHAEIEFKDVRVPAENLLLGEGRGFEIAQGRLGPGRIHHCMRAIGVAERALEKMCKRLISREAFGKTIAEHSVWEQRVADARTQIDMGRLLVFNAAYMMDTVGNRVARSEIAQIKVAVPNITLKILDTAIQAFGAAGVTTDPGLAKAYANARTLRIVDGPDEVHNRTIARLEFGKYR